MAFCYGQNIDTIAGQGLAERRSPADVSEVRVAFYFEHHVLEIAVGVGVAVGEVDLVIIVEEVVVPAECEVGFIAAAALAVAVLIIEDVVSFAMPADVLLLAFPFGVDDDLHAHLVKVVHLVVVQDVKLADVALDCVGNLEEEPL